MMHSLPFICMVGRLRSSTGSLICLGSMQLTASGQHRAKDVGLGWCLRRQN